MVWYNRPMPRDGNATRQRLLEVAERLMTDQGYSATSVDQVITEAASSKGALHTSARRPTSRQLVDRYWPRTGPLDAVGPPPESRPHRPVGPSSALRGRRGRAMASDGSVLHRARRRNFNGSEIITAGRQATLVWVRRVVRPARRRRRPAGPTPPSTRRAGPPPLHTSRALHPLPHVRRPSAHARPTRIHRQSSRYSSMRLPSDHSPASSAVWMACQRHGASRLAVLAGRRGP